MARPVGVDISKYQAPADLTKPHGINFQLMVDFAAFIIARAGYAGSAGGAWVDPRIHEYLKDLVPLLEQRRIPFTLYWFFRDDVSVMDQVNQFASVYSACSWVVNMPLVVDCEAFTKDNALSTQKIIDFQAEVERQTAEKVDICYGRAGQLNAETVPGLEVVLPKLWIARYDSRLDEQVDQPWEEGGPQEYVEPRDWDDWLFWQYTDAGNEKLYGVTSGAIGIDLNVFNGTMEELRSFAGLDEPDVPEEFYGTKVHFQSFPGGSDFVAPFNPLKDTTVPKFGSISFGKGTIQTINTFLVIEGVPFKVSSHNLRYRDFLFIEFPKAHLGPEDYLFFDVKVVPGWTEVIDFSIAWW